MDQPSIDGITHGMHVKLHLKKIKVLLSGVGGDELFWLSSFGQIPYLINFTSLIKKIPFGDKVLTFIGDKLYRKTKNQKWKYLNFLFKCLHSILA